MNTQEQNKKNLDFIFKNGDLYDIISLKDGRALAKNPFFSFAAFLINVNILSSFGFNPVFSCFKI